MACGCTVALLQTDLDISVSEISLNFRKMIHVDFNDLWKYSGGMWTWISGANVANQYGTYGTVKTPDSTTVPGARHGSAGWIDSSSNLWFFGGSGRGSSFQGYLNDLWSTNPVPITSGSISTKAMTTKSMTTKVTPPTIKRGDKSTIN